MKNRGIWDPEEEKIRECLFSALGKKNTKDFVIQYSTESSFLDPETLTEDHLKRLLFIIIALGDARGKGGRKTVSYCQNGIRFFLIWSKDAEKEFTLYVSEQCPIFQRIADIVRTKSWKRAEGSWKLNTKALSVTCKESISINSVVQTSKQLFKQASFNL